MSQTITVPMQNHVASDLTRLTLCIKATRQDGTPFAWTEHDWPLDIDLDAMGYSDGDGLQSYLSAPGFVREAFEQQSLLRVSSTEISGALDSAGLTRADINSGRWDLAEVKVFFANWADTSAAMGIIPVDIAYVDRVQITELVFRAGLRGVIDKLNTTNWLYVWGPRCRAIYGSVAPAVWRCGVQLDPAVFAAGMSIVARPRRDARAPAATSPPTYNTLKPTTFNGFHYEAQNAGTTVTEPTWPTTEGATVTHDGITWKAVLAKTLVSSVAADSSDRRIFTLSGYTGLAPDDFYRGVATFGAGSNNLNLSMEVKSFTNGNLTSPTGPVTVELMLPMPFDIEALDPVTITAYCSKTGDDDPAGCFRRSDNIFNFAGANIAPTDRDVFQILT